MNLPINREEALNLIEQYSKNNSDIIHYLESEAIMGVLARRLGENEEYWKMLGLLHDVDWGITKSDTKKHLTKAPDILKKAGFDDKFIQTVLSHGYGWDCADLKDKKGEYKWRTIEDLLKEKHGIYTTVSNIKRIFYRQKKLKDKKRTENVEYALACAETVTGLIHSYALMRKSFEGMEVNGLKKKMKDKRFAAGINREVILECEKIGLSLDEFLDIAIKAVQSIAKEVGF